MERRCMSFVKLLSIYMFCSVSCHTSPFAFSFCPEKFEPGNGRANPFYDIELNINMYKREERNITRYTVVAPVVRVFYTSK